MAVITTIRRNVKNGARCSVFVDEEFFAACPIDVAVALGLKKGLEMTPDLEQRLRKEDRRMVLKQKSYRFATYKPRTERQVRDHLRKLEATDEELAEVFGWLEEFNLVNDVEYARRFVAASQERKPLSPSDVRRKLKAKGITDPIIDEEIQRSYTDEIVYEAACKVAEKKLPTIKGEGKDRLRKLAQFLQYRGYSWSVVKRVVEDISEARSALVLIAVLTCSAVVMQAQSILTCDKVRLPDAINAFQPTTQPVLSPDGRLFLDRKLHPDNSDGITDPDDVWISEQRSPIAWSAPTQAPFTTIRRPDVLFNFTPDGLHALVVGRYGRGSDSTASSFAIISRRTQTALFDGLEVLDVGDLGKNYYGFLSADRQHVVVSLEQTGGAGDLDLLVMRYCDGQWSSPRSLGDAINTAGMEGAPWLAMDGSTLFFASNGRGDRRGKADIYMTTRLDSTWRSWTTPLNLGSCVNSQEDETSVSLSPGETSAYLTSWDAESMRPGVYRVSLPPDRRPTPVCRYDAQVVNGANGQAIVNYRISIRDSTTNGECSVPLFYSDSVTGTTVIPIPEGHSFVLETVADGYTRHTQTITVRDLDSTVELRTTVHLFDQNLPLASVFFERGSDELSDSAMAVITSVIERYRSQKLRFYVDGYADRIGGGQTNQALSAARAQKVARALVERGLDEWRVIMAGKGVEQVPGVEDEEYPQSRRVDIFARSES